MRSPPPLCRRWTQKPTTTSGSDWAYPSLSSVGLFGRNALQLPLRAILLGYRQEKLSLVLELRDSSYPYGQNTKAPVQTSSRPGYLQAETQIDCWQDTVRENWPGAGDCSEDVVQSHKEGEDRTSDFRGGQDRGGELSDQSP